uniref:Uncharacterized protein n=1 Tax=Globodera rostochiensis TaxID=31243 RepID=A0A914H9F5_GLORO
MVRKVGRRKKGSGMRGGRKLKPQFRRDWREAQFLHQLTSRQRQQKPFDAPIEAESVLLVPFSTTNDVQTETDQEFSVERLCAELNAARRKIALLERNLRMKEEELALTRSRPGSRTGNCSKNSTILQPKVTGLRGPKTDSTCAASSLALIIVRSGAIKHAKIQEYTGDHMRRLLRASEEIRSIGTLFASEIADLLNDVRELHTEMFCCSQLFSGQ